MSQEFQWNNVLMRFRKIHVLQVIKIKFLWHEFRYRKDLDAERKNEIMKYRLRLVDTLKTYTVPCCQVTGSHSWMSQYDYGRLELLIQQLKAVPPKPAKMYLGDVIARCKALRVEREEWEAWEQRKARERQVSQRTSWLQELRRREQARAGHGMTRNVGW